MSLSEIKLRWPLLWVVCWLACSFPAAALDPNKTILQYAHSAWGYEQGLPHTTVPAVLQTRDGYLWFGTELGLARFDGVRFSVFDRRNTPQLRSNVVQALAEDSEGTLWIGTNGGGLTRYRAGKFLAVTANLGLSNSAQSLYVDRFGSVWVGTDGDGIFSYRRGSFQHYTVKDGLSDNSVFAFAEDTAGNFWIGTHNGLNLLAGGKFTVYATKDGLPSAYIHSLCPDAGGGLWIGTNGGGVSHWKDRKFFNLTTKDGLGSNAVSTVLQDRGGTLWVGTFGGGLSRLTKEGFASYNDKNGLGSNDVWAIKEDRSGNLWIGTSGGGVRRLADGRITSWSTLQGLSDNVALGVLLDRSGALWVGTAHAGINRLRDGKFTAFTQKDGLSDNFVLSTCEDRHGDIWAGTRKGLNQIANGKVRVYTTRDGLPNDSVLALYAARDGTIWAGTRGGLSKFADGRFTNFTTGEGLSNNHVIAILEDYRGDLWVGTEGGLNRLHNGKFTVFGVFGKHSGLSNSAIMSLFEDSDKALWIGTNGGGLNRLKDGRFTVYSTASGLPDDAILGILEDKQGNLWMSCNKGIFRVRKQDLNSFAEGTIRSLEPTTYGRADGMESEECNGGFQPAAWKGSDGKLWFPTMKGVVSIDTNKLAVDKRLFPVFIEQAMLNRKLADPGSSAQVGPGRGELEFKYTAIDFQAPDKIHFEYKLEGFDHDWIEAGTRRTAYYTNIPPGSYRFTVIAQNSEGIWNSTGASLNLVLKPHFYQTYSFMAFCATLLGGLCFAIYAWRIRHLKANEMRLCRLVDERTQALREEIRAKERAHAELAEAQQSLLELSRRAGMAEVASGVLHNVGNVLNSVNVGASVIVDKLRGFRIENLSAAVNMLDEHAHDLSGFVEKDAKGQRVLPYLVKLAQNFQTERNLALTELENLTGHIDHIKEIVATQQDCAKGSDLTEIVSIPKVVEQALRVVDASLERHQVDLIRELDDVPEVKLAKHKLIEILVNLIRNAKQSVMEQDGAVREVRVSVRKHAADRIRIEVRDSGVGLSAENLTRIFAHGFTTKRDGHGFGLHSGALAAKQMGGSLWAESPGPQLGATFVLELPVGVAAAAPALSAQ